MTKEDLDRILSTLNQIRGDHQWVEAKKARDELPIDLWKSFSAFANTRGGQILLGVSETSGKFTVTGVSDPAGMGSKITSWCLEAEPQISPLIHPVIYDDKTVLVVEIECPSPGPTPCHFPKIGDEYTTAYRRSNDGNTQIPRAAVDEIKAIRTSKDYSAGPAPEGAKLSEALLAATFTVNSGDLDEVLRGSGVTRDDGSPTLAGWLAFGKEHRAGVAKVVCIKDVKNSDQEEIPIAKHIEGSVGELLSGVLRWFRENLTLTPIRKNGEVFDEADFPLEALREAISNALVHRSVAPTFLQASCKVYVDEELIVITSPGGLIPAVDIRKLGFGVLATPKNYALVQLVLALNLQTTTGARIAEGSTWGIKGSDRLCYRSAVAPFIFIDNPEEFTVVAIRGKLPLTRVTARWPSAALSDEQIRILAFLVRLEEFQTDDPLGILRNIVLDSYLAARLMAAKSNEGAVKELNELVERGILIEESQYDRPIWSLPTSPAEGQKELVKKKSTPKRNKHIRTLLLAIDSAPGKKLLTVEIPEAMRKILNAEEPPNQRLVNRLIVEAENEGLVQSEVRKAQNKARTIVLASRGASEVQSAKANTDTKVDL
ncbi:MAG: RNA-binding domain-containing protein [Actinomycetes bacterium]